jgi:MoaA/NifB/PqqE/SkfB family radical SAM enzyme
MMTSARFMSLTGRGMRNYILRQPFCISFEVTHCCNAKCKQCHLGGVFKEVRATPEHLGRICRELKPLVAQISGGEPLLRQDLLEIVSEFKRPNRAPYIDITTNGILLTAEGVDQLLHAGVDKIGISLDYPDDRHDRFRRAPGLFRHIEKLMADLNGKKEKAVTLLCVVRRDNYRDLIRMAELAAEWKVKINFSAYTWLRTRDKGYMLSVEDLTEFRDVAAKFGEISKISHHVSTNQYVWSHMADFFESQSAPNCRTGWTFINVNPDGTFSPCGLIIKDYCTRRELLDEFSRNNTCTDCYTNIRAQTEKPLVHLIKDYIKPWRKI